MGATIAKLFGKNPESQIDEDLRRMKQLLETGEIATTEGQSSGRRSAPVKAMEAMTQTTKREPTKKGWNRDVVSSASEESFPASDPPSWTPVTL